MSFLFPAGRALGFFWGPLLSQGARTNPDWWEVTVVVLSACFPRNKVWGKAEVWTCHWEVWCQGLKSEWRGEWQREKWEATKTWCSQVGHHFTKRHKITEALQMSSDKLRQNPCFQHRPSQTEHLPIPMAKWHGLAWTCQGAAVAANILGLRKQENRRTNTDQGSYSGTHRD